MRCPKCGDELDSEQFTWNSPIIYYCPNCGFQKEDC